MSASRVPLHRRLGFQLGLAATLVTGTVFGALGWLLVQHERDTLARELTLRVVVATRSLAATAGGSLLKPDPEFALHPMIQRALDSDPSLVDITVLDHQGTIQGHQDLQLIGQKLEPAREREAAFRFETGEETWFEGPHLVIIQPIRHLDQDVGVLIAKTTQDEIAAGVKNSVVSIVRLASGGLAVLLLSVLFLVARGLKPLASLQNAVDRIGSGDLSARVSVRSGNELGTLAELINTMAGGLETAQHERIERERLDRELEIARDLQKMLLPQVLPAVDRYGLAAHYTPALEVSGDYYDVIGRRDGTACLVIADVSGKGVPGLVIMAMLRIVLRSLAYEATSPVQVLTAAHRILEGSMRRDMFVTCLFGILDPAHDRLVYANAGHCPPVVFGNGAVPRPLGPGGNAVGMLPESVFVSNLREQEIRLEPGQGVLLYTDGLVEAMNASRQQLGESATFELLSEIGAEGPATVVREMVELVKRHRGAHPATDDLTLLVVERSGVHAGAREVVRS